MHFSPRQRDDSDPRADNGDDDDLVGSDHPVLVVVDDDPALRESLAEVLRDERYVVATASDGQEAIALMKNGLRPSLVLLDLWMPVLDGVTTLRIMRTTPGLAEIPVVVITASPEDADESVRADAQAVLKKPVSLNRIVAVIETYRRRGPERADAE